MKAILIKYYKHFSLVKMPKMLKKKHTVCFSNKFIPKKKVVGNQLVTCSSKKTELCAELRFSFPMIILGIQTNSNVTNINVFSADNKTKTMIMEGRQESVAAHICLFTIQKGNLLLRSSSRCSTWQLGTVYQRKYYANSSALLLANVKHAEERFPSSRRGRTL